MAYLYDGDRCREGDIHTCSRGKGSCPDGHYGGWICNCKERAEYEIDKYIKEKSGGTIMDFNLNNIRTKNETLVKALRILVEDIQSEDGVANACIAEAASRIDELDKEVLQLKMENFLLKNTVSSLQSQLEEKKYRI